MSPPHPTPVPHPLTGRAAFNGLGVVLLVTSLTCFFCSEIPGSWVPDIVSGDTAASEKYAVSQLGMGIFVTLALLLFVASATSFAVAAFLKRRG